MALEQTVKDLQAQNAQFQEMFTNLVQGQKDLKKLITRKKKTIGVLMGRNCKGSAKVVSRLEISDKSGETDESVKNSEGSHHGSENREEDYLSEQYPLDDDRYKQLEDRLNAVENLKNIRAEF